ncbi:hypothetical protein AURDEDRAFT_177883 [Auricularia subglabra TFB-10046 SS5]|uniref:Uncharacterized protein n=1 Tax=Auricularia subglabra (strain TFB-10046 / SS5) TaxID=717982 RepID=J0WL52_AURST|nr:hypothetical protein AURDEDRAFT_177883 [Auricularia subglabra TFB-10046 SS5]
MDCSADFSDTNSEDALLDQLLDVDRTPRPSAAQRRMPRHPRRSSSRSSVSSAASSEYFSFSGSIADEDTAAEPQTSRPIPLRATRSQTREQTAKLPPREGSVVLLEATDAHESRAIDFAAPFNDPLPEHLVSRNMPEPVRIIADNLCRAWDAHWVLSEELLNDACAHAALWPSTQLNRVFGLTCLILDNYPDWDMPSAIRDVLPATKWSSGGTQYAPSNMMVQLNLWSPVNRACVRCSEKSRVTICAVSADVPDGKCWFCGVSRKACTLAVHFDNEIRPGDSADEGAQNETWQMVLKKGKHKRDVLPSASAATIKKALQNESTAVKSRPSKRSAQKRSTGLSNRAGKSTTSMTCSPSWTASEADSDAEASTLPLVGHGDALGGAIMAHVSYPSLSDEETAINREPMVYRRATGNGVSMSASDPAVGAESVGDALKGIRDVVVMLSKDIAEMVREEQQVQQRAMSELQGLKAQLASTTVQSTGPGAVVPIQGATLAALRIGPCEAFRADGANVSDLVETLITELPHGYDFCLPVSVRRGRNPKFAMACFEDATDRDMILKEWLAADGKHSEITVVPDEVAR